MASPARERVISSNQAEYLVYDAWGFLERKAGSPEKFKKVGASNIVYKPFHLTCSLALLFYYASPSGKFGTCIGYPVPSYYYHYNNLQPSV